MQIVANDARSSSLLDECHFYGSRNRGKTFNSGSRFAPAFELCVTRACALLVLSTASH